MWIMIRTDWKMVNLSGGLIRNEGDVEGFVGDWRGYGYGERNG